MSFRAALLPDSTLRHQPSLLRSTPAPPQALPEGARHAPPRSSPSPPWQGMSHFAPQVTFSFRDSPGAPPPGAPPPTDSHLVNTARSLALAAGISGPESRREAAADQMRRACLEPTARQVSRREREVSFFPTDEEKPWLRGGARGLGHGRAGLGKVMVEKGRVGYVKR